MRKRAEAIDELTRIEIKFAKLRDMLYLERLADVEKERIGIETGTHPELIHLTQLIELRRNRKLELARKWFDGLSHAYQVQLDEREHANWHWWEDERARSRMRYFDEANSKRRRLEREKRTLERPKDGADLFSLLDGSSTVADPQSFCRAETLIALLAPRPHPAVPLEHRRRVGFDGEPLGEQEIAWAVRQSDLRADSKVQGLDYDAAQADLEQMGVRHAVMSLSPSSLTSASSAARTLSARPLSIRDRLRASAHAFDRDVYGRGRIPVRGDRLRSVSAAAGVRQFLRHSAATSRERGPGTTTVIFTAASRDYALR